MPGATLVSARPFYHILLKMSIGKMHKKTRPTPRGLGSGLLSRFVWAVPKVRPLTPSNKPLLGSLLCPAGMGVD